jgi:CubicO group peptidase (beta-lactamase class C family)
MSRFRGCFLSAAALLTVAAALRAQYVYPQAEWAAKTPQEAGLSGEKLEALRDLVGGRGCVVRGGFLVFTWGDPARSSDVASAFKPLLSTLLFIAVQEGRLRSVDDEVSEIEPRLKALDGGKNSTMSWRHLASQTSGYGLAERPGEAYAYNDYALALYYDTLMDKVFHDSADRVLETRLAGPLQFQDPHTFAAFGPKNRPGRLAISVRDFARFGLLYLRHGRWRENQLVNPEFVQMALSSPVPPMTPLTNGRETEMLPRQRSIGGGKNITPVGPGFYSFNWWLNRTNRDVKRLFVDAPHDAFIASGHGGMRALWVLPSIDLVVCWNESTIDDHDQSPGNPDTRMNRAARLMREAVETPNGAN